MGGHGIVAAARIGIGVAIVAAVLAPGAVQAQTGKKFYGLTPCRVVDTRTSVDPAAVKRGNFADDEMRVYALSTSTDCPGLPASAAAWSLNIQFRPLTQVAYVTTYPDGVGRPVVSTLVGYPDSWTINNAIVPAGPGGAIDVYCQYAGRLIVDVNGYFAP